MIRSAKSWSSCSEKTGCIAQCWIGSLRGECLNQLVLFGQRSLAYALREYVAHHQGERNHQGLDNLIPFPDERLRNNTGPLTKSERLGGLLQYYYRKAA
jgi:putative transposase